jgi:hypothetical protein
MDFVNGGAGAGAPTHLEKSIMSKKAKLVVTVWKGLVDSVISDTPISAVLLVVDRDSEKTEFQELEIEVNPEKVDESYAEAETFWGQEDDD